MRRPRHREMRAFFSCMAWRGIPSPLSKLHQGNAKESSNYHTIALISRASEEMLKILQATIRGWPWAACTSQVQAAQVQALG